MLSVKFGEMSQILTNICLNRTTEWNHSFPKMFRIIKSKFSGVRRINHTGIRQISNLFEPDYLAELQPKVPVYPSVNFQITSYDFTALESYHRFLNRTANSLDLDISENWAVPPKHLQITRLRPKADTVESEYKLLSYERNLQIYDLAAHFYPIYLRLIQAALPEGVTLKVAHHIPEIEEIRYMPDTQLKELQGELEDLGGARKINKKKK